MNKLFGRMTATMTAALAVATIAGPMASAQVDPIVLDGRVWFDRNNSWEIDPGEPMLAGQPAVKITNRATREVVGEFRTDDDGRYRIELPGGVEYRLDNLNWGKYSATTAPIAFRKESGTIDFGLRGATVHGSTFVDTNLDGVRQDGEQALPYPNPNVVQPLAVLVGEDGVERRASLTAQDATYRVEDVPAGKYTFSAADFRHEQYEFAKPLGDNEVDWLTGSKQVEITQDFEDVRIDVRYFEPRHDAAAGEIRIDPARESYRTGDVVKAVVPVVNRGESPTQASVRVEHEGAEFVSISDNVITNGRWHALDKKLLPGESADVVVTLKLTSDQAAVVDAEVEAFGTPDADKDNNRARRELKIALPDTTTPTTDPTTPPSETTTTTPAPVAVAGADNDGLASTGASPMLFLLVGGVLLGGGALTVLIARRRRA